MHSEEPSLLLMGRLLSGPGCRVCALLLPPRSRRTGEGIEDQVTPGHSRIDGQTGVTNS